MAGTPQSLPYFSRSVFVLCSSVTSPALHGQHGNGQDPLEPYPQGPKVTTNGQGSQIPGSIASVHSARRPGLAKCAIFVQDVAL